MKKWTKTLHAMIASTVIGGAAVAGPVGTGVGTLGSCITTDPYLPGARPGIDDVIFRSVPVGCWLRNEGGPFSFLNVPDPSGGLHDIVISTLLFFQLAGTVDGSAHIVGTIDGTPFTYTDPSTSGDRTGTLLSGPQALGVKTVADLARLEIDLADPLSWLALAPGTLARYEQLVVDNGDGTFTVSTGGRFVLAATLDGGATFVAEDPPFTMAPYTSGVFADLDAFVAANSVAAPGTLGLALLALAPLVRGPRRARPAGA